MSRDDYAALSQRLRDSPHNDEVLLSLLLKGWERLSPAQRQATYRMVDLFVCAAAWRRSVGHDPAVVLDLDAMPRTTREGRL